MAAEGYSAESNCGEYKYGCGPWMTAITRAAVETVGGCLLLLNRLKRDVMLHIHQVAERWLRQGCEEV